MCSFIIYGAGDLVNSSMYWGFPVWKSAAHCLSLSQELQFSVSRFIFSCMRATPAFKHHLLLADQIENVLCIENLIHFNNCTQNGYYSRTESHPIPLFSPRTFHKNKKYLYRDTRRPLGHKWREKWRQAIHIIGKWK